MLWSEVDPYFVGLKLIQFLGPPLRKRIQSYAYKIWYKVEYSFMNPPKALEEAHATEGPISFSFTSFTVNLLLVVLLKVTETLY
jgi:hypothetical protein